MWYGGYYSHLLGYSLGKKAHGVEVGLRLGTARLSFSSALDLDARHATTQEKLSAEERLMIVCALVASCDSTTNKTRSKNCISEHKERRHTGNFTGKSYQKRVA